MINEDNVIINTPEKELETEPQNIPQGEKPFINPNPGYGEDGETKPAIKTVIFPSERGIRSEVVTPLQEGVKVERNLVNFLKGLLIKGKPLEEYIDSQGGVTEEELQAALANYYKKTETYSKQETETFVNNALVADKDIISKISMDYDEDTSITTVTFPEGLIPLSITLNNLDLYFLNAGLVNDNGQSAVGYGVVDYYAEDGEIILEIEGDISEQVISRLVYIPVSGGAGILINTYYLFYPTKAGTKLYKHVMNLDSEANSYANVISTKSTAYTSETLNQGQNGVISISVYDDSASYDYNCVLLSLSTGGYTPFGGNGSTIANYQLQGDTVTPL